MIGHFTGTGDSRYCAQMLADKRGKAVESLHGFDKMPLSGCKYGYDTTILPQ